MTDEGPQVNEYAPQGTYCDACREVYGPYVELYQVPGGQRFTFCQFCACEHGAIPLSELDEAAKRVWARLKERVEVLRG